jgi:hypothetical protein
MTIIVAGSGSEITCCHEIERMSSLDPAMTTGVRSDEWMPSLRTNARPCSYELSRTSGTNETPRSRSASARRGKFSSDSRVPASSG